MAATPSTMLEIGTQAPVFDLPNTNGLIGPPWVSKNDYDSKPLLIAFICNHCPFVVLIKDKLAELGNAWQQKGIAVIAISSNDVQSYPADSPEKMTEFAKAAGFDFPYLFDESQEIAKHYQASCTPDFFLFDEHHKLVYRGQFDDSRPGNNQSVSGDDLNKAVIALLNNEAPVKNQKPSIGCNIKWIKDNEPDYY